MQINAIQQTLGVVILRAIMMMNVRPIGHFVNIPLLVQENNLAPTEPVKIRFLLI
jgi:hypothetical protein